MSAPWWRELTLMREMGRRRRSSLYRPRRGPLCALRRHPVCQGPRFGANSAVLLLLFRITEVASAKAAGLFERFDFKRTQRNRTDIDVDFGHERREEVLQYIYDNYGLDRAALAATGISTVQKAPQGVGRALAVSSAPDSIDSPPHWTWWTRPTHGPSVCENAATTLTAPLARSLMIADTQLVGLPAT